MADTRGTFRLKNVRQDVLNNEYVSIPNVWIANDKFGHGSYLPGNLVRYNTSNSTVTNTSNQASTNDGPGGGSQTHTYWSGGGSNSSNIRKLTYSTYTYESNLPIDILTPARNSMGTVSKETDVYYTGSAYPSIGTQSSTQKLTFSSDSIALVPGSPYPTAQSEQASFTGGGSYGYFWSGVNNPVNSKIHRLTFSNDTFSILPASEPTQYRYGWNLGNTTKGYAVGGVWVSTANKLTYSGETFAAVPSANYPRAIGTGVAFTAGGDTGLYTAGRNPSGPGHYSDTHLLTFSTDSWALDSAMNNTATPTNYDYGTGKGTSARDSKIGGSPSYTEDGSTRWFDDATEPVNTGYSYEGSQGDTAYKTDLSSDTAATNPGAQQLTDVFCQAAVSSSTAGYASGGRTGSPPSNAVSITQKTTYSSDTLVRLPGANLPERIHFNSGISDGTAGWYWGGHKYPTSYNWTNIYKITYATDAMSTPGAQMTAGVYNASSTNSETAGYNAGGAGDYTNVDKLVFSTEATSSLPAVLPLHGNMYGTAATGTQTAGYWGGGASRTDVSKMTWATETAELTPSGFLSQGRNYMFSLGNTTDGYFCGGTPSPARTVDKLDYSTDTSAVSPSLGPSPMKNSSQNIGMGARAKGIPVTLPPTATPTASTFPSTNPALNVNCIFKGGYGQPGSNPVSFQDKMTYSNETISSLPSFTTVGEIHTMGGGSSTTKGYTAGGFSSGTSGGTRNYRGYHTYSNDTSGKVPGNALAGGNGGGGMFGMNSETEFWSGGGGWSNNQYTYVDKMVFATETGTANPARLSQMAKYCAGIGNKTVGFVCGGNTGPHGNNGNRTNIDKLVYSTGTMSRSTSNTTLAGTTPYRFCAAVGTKDVGYIGGGGTNKLVFSTETISTAPAGVGSGSANGVSSIEAGYTAAGSPAEYVLKYTFATESYSTLPGKFPSPSNRKRSRWGAVSTSMFAGAYTSVPNVI